MLNLNDIQGFVEENMEMLDDQTVSTGGGDFTYELLALGKHRARLISYVELGEHPQKAYQGAEKPPADMVMLKFQFLDKRDIKDRDDGKGQYAPTKTVFLKKSYHEKAAFRKLFEKMRNGNSSIKNMAQMVGSWEGLIEVQYSVGTGDSRRVIKTKTAYEEAKAAYEADKKNKDLRIWDNIRDDEGFLVSAAMKPKLDDEGDETGEFVPVKVPPHIGGLQFFLWDNPQPQFWESIFIDGTYTKKEGDKEVEVSKNRLQNQIKEALNYEGSPIQIMLEGDIDLAAAGDNGDSAADEIEDDDEPDDEPDTSAEEADDGGSEMDELGL